MTEDSDQAVKEEKENVKSSVTISKVKTTSPNKTTSSSANSQKRDKTRETQPTRIVIRHLPPTMTSEEFLEAISPIAEHNDYYFCRADTSLGNFCFCRAYINFIHMEDVFIFKDKFDGYVFVDAKGNEFPAIVEFAPFQRIFRRRVGPNGQPITAKKRDNKSGTIEQDPDYIQFLEDLEKMKTEANMPSADVYLEEIEAREKAIKANHGCLKVSTPLIEYIKNKKIEKNRLREERREERRRQQLEQKRLREEEQNKKMKVLKAEDKPHRESDQKAKEKTEDDKPKGGERFKERSKDFDKKSRNTYKRDEKKSDSKRSDKRYSNSHRSDKPKDSSKDKESKDSTFVVKVVQNSEEKKSKVNVDRSESQSSESNVNIDSKEQTNTEYKEKSDSKKSDKAEGNSFKDKNESSKSDSKRIRNKDRPTREIYRPGAKRTTDSSQSQGQNSGGQKSSSSKAEPTGSGYKQRVFTRSKP